MRMTFATFANIYIIKVLKIMKDMSVDIYLLKVTIETLEQGVKYAQS